ncbi:ABC transporter permease [Chitinophaga sedimenti]|uniref:ABC transporter permease n=1 Tax=Chitinophaga sedimenti TaxID=2033606 RepID=UPI0020051CFB|nr:ABC transporter permease [Chitinophaga sedimenti]MCK7554221.1 ABC transporter permease [Chitinophaga sedimenti]
MKLGVNTEIAFTYMISRIKSTVVAAMGVTFGIGVFIFMSSLITGTNDYSEKTMLSATPHIRLFNDNTLSDNHMLDKYLGDSSINLISNPQLVPKENRIYNPDAVMAQLFKHPGIEAISKQVQANVIYSKGNVQKNGTAFGVNMPEQDKMFDISFYMIAGNVQSLEGHPDHVIIGAGVAANLNARLGDYIRLTTSGGLVKTLKVSGIFRTTIKAVDDTKSYVNIPVVQQLLQKDRSYITDIYINIKDYYNANAIGAEMAREAGYSSESRQQANQQSLAGRKIRDIIANSIVFTILLVAGFGIYNILNMVIYEKIKEIAILKATGFQGIDVVSIFLQQALFIGIVGSMLGIVFGWILSFSLSKLYIGIGNVRYLPITF